MGVQQTKQHQAALYCISYCVQRNFFSYVCYTAFRGSMILHD